MSEVSETVQSETVCSVKDAAWQTLIVDDSTDMSVHKLLVIFMKHREQHEVNYKSVLLTGCTAQDVV